MYSNFELVMFRYYCHSCREHFVRWLPWDHDIICQECGKTYVTIDEPADPDKVIRILVLPDDSNEVQSEVAELDKSLKCRSRHRFHSQEKDKCSRRNEKDLYPG